MPMSNTRNPIFAWFDLMTNDPARAQRFYEALLGWTFKEMDMGPMGIYRLAHVGDAGIGGIGHSRPEDNIPNHWLPYAATTDLDGLVNRARESGGQVPVPPTPIPSGRFAVVLDRQGGALGAVQSEGPEMFGEPQGPGQLVWCELHSTDVDDALAFYTTVNGFRTKGFDMGPMGTYHLLLAEGDRDAGGIFKNQAPHLPSHWLCYVSVADVDASAAQVEGLGGKVLAKPGDIPGGGRFAVVADPTGAAFALYAHKPTPA
jgi:hypothetical protein